MAYHVKCAERNIFNSVFSVHHGGNGHCGVDTAEQTFTDVANGYRNGIEGSSLSCNNARARFSYILLNLAEVKLGGVDSRSGISFLHSFIGTFEILATDHGMKEESPCSPKT